MSDSVGLVEAQDIVGKAAESGEDSGISADAGGVFAHRDVAGVVELVFDMPVLTNCVGGERGIEGSIGQVESGFGVVGENQVRVTSSP